MKLSLFLIFFGFSICCTYENCIFNFVVLFVRLHRLFVP